MSLPGARKKSGLLNYVNQYVFSILKPFWNESSVQLKEPNVEFGTRKQELKVSSTDVKLAELTY